MPEISIPKHQKNRGFSLVEILIVLGILIILMGMAVPAFRVFQKSSDLDGQAEKIIDTLRLAQNKTVASEESAQYGVYFDNSVWPNKYTLFRGSDYSLRNASFDVAHNLPSQIEIHEIDLGGGGGIYFEKLTGYTSSSASFGKISIRLKDDVSKTKTVYIENSGLAGLTLPAIPLDTGRLSDSRHIHFDYNRTINTANEKIVLDFTTVNQEIVIADNLKDGQIYWEGVVNVDGSDQKIKIHTHRLNSFDTQFCVHRDRRYDDKALTISISGDLIGESLINYTDAGQETRGTSANLTIGSDGDPKRQ
jgi:type II secretory pathway pseudopilin PulG